MRQEKCLQALTGWCQYSLDVSPYLLWTWRDTPQEHMEQQLDQLWLTSQAGGEVLQQMVHNHEIHLWSSKWLGRQAIIVWR